MNQSFHGQHGFRLSSQQRGVLACSRAWKEPLFATARMELARGVTTERLIRGLESLSLRHEILRTRYQDVAGLAAPIQVVSALPCYRLQLENGEVRENGDAVLAATVCRRAMGVELELRASLAALDERAVAQCVRELDQLLAGHEPIVAEKLEYADYAEWENDLLGEELGQRGLSFWRSTASESDLRAELPFELERSPSLQMSRVSAGAFDLPVVNRDLSLEKLTFALWLAFVARLTQQPFGVSMFRATECAPELADTLGRFSRRIPVACRIEPTSSVRENLQLAVACLEESLSWKECYREEEVLPGRELRYAFGFVWHEESYAGIEVDEYEPEKLRLEYRGGVLSVAYAQGLFEPAVVQCWLEQFQSFAQQAAGDVEQVLERVSLLSPAQRVRVLGQHCLQRPVESGQQLLHQLFEEQVERTPQAIAVRVGLRELSYAGLERESNRVAERLRASGVRADEVVGVYADRSIEMIVGIVGVLKSGAAYLPLDPSYPVGRVRYMVEDAGVRCVVSTREWKELPDIRVIALGGEEREVLPEAAEAKRRLAVHPSNLAYVIYTSGSSGQPKAVQISHANAVASTRSRIGFYAEAVQRFLLLSSFSFDSSVAGIFWTLSQGGTLCLPEEEEHRDVWELARRVEEWGITHLLALPSLYELLLERLGSHDLRCVIVAGESCPESLPGRHFQRCARTELVNEYGPTEGTVWSSAWRIERSAGSAVIPIGAPIARMQGYVLDEALQPVGIGMSGELYLGGAGIARGYLGRPGLTAERFVAGAFGVAGERLYRTGDLVRERPDGVLEYLGRIDQQVKIRGYRIELGEIETRLREFPDVADAVVVAHEMSPGDQRLVAYVIAQNQTATDAAARAEEKKQWLAHLRDVLPEYMVPAFLVILPQFPRTANGKVDRKALPSPHDAPDRVVHTAPRTAMERALADIWAEVLQTTDFGVHDNFFEVGGHSLLATQLAQSIGQYLGRNVPLAQVFQAQTIASFVESIHATKDDEDRTLILLEHGAERAPLFCIHHGGGDVIAYRPFARSLQGYRPVYGLQSRLFCRPGWVDESITAMAQHYAHEILKVSNEACVFGWSIGATLAVEVVHRLQERGAQVRFLGLIDPVNLISAPRRAANGRAVTPANASADIAARFHSWVARSAMAKQWSALFALANEGTRLELNRQFDSNPGFKESPSFAEEFRLLSRAQNIVLMRQHAFRGVDAPTHIWWARETLRGAGLDDPSSLIPELSRTDHVIEGNHRQIIASPALRASFVQALGADPSRA